MVKKVSVLIPTIYSRPDYLRLALDSVISQTGNFELRIFLGCPANKAEAIAAEMGEGFQVLVEPTEGGLAFKLDKLLQEAGKGSDFLTWLGDDDLLLPSSLEIAVNELESDSQLSLVYGGCDYMDSQGNIIFTNHSGPIAGKILRFGPQLIPQPGSLFRTEDFIKSGGLDETLDLAFDFDLFLKLSKLGKVKYLGITVARFRWHPDSLSVKKRMRSALEASKVRRTHYSGLGKLLWPLWEPFVIMATWAAGKLVSFRTRSVSSKTS